MLVPKDPNTFPAGNRMVLASEETNFTLTERILCLKKQENDEQQRQQVNNVMSRRMTWFPSSVRNSSPQEPHNITYI